MKRVGDEREIERGNRTVFLEPEVDIHLKLISYPHNPNPSVVRETWRVISVSTTSVIIYICSEREVTYQFVDVN